jgi:hypothetical protein
MQTTVTLGGQQYTITEPSVKKAREWRKKVAQPFGSMIDALQATKEVDLQNVEGHVKGMGLDGVATALERYALPLLGSPDILIDLFFDWATNLQEQRETIEEEAATSEFIAAFLEALKLAYPLGAALPLVTGALAQLTSSNSPIANTKSGTKR